uniref:Putative CRM domain-containing protein, chloroplastic n=1 Tax=Noccaea caerulescens TaxID=107243 RepID=A0A1J3JI30_NOCCA
MSIAFVRSLQRASSLLRSSYPLVISSRLLPQSRELSSYSTSTFLVPTISTIPRPKCRNFSHGTVNLVISEGKPKFETRELDPPKKWKWLTKKRLKLKRKKEREERNAANRKDPRRLTVKGKKRKFANPEERIKNKLEKAKIKEALLVEKLKRYEVAKVQGPEVRPHEITGEERFYLKKMGQKRSNYVPIGRRGVFGGVILNMHLHWKKHETVKVICNNSKPGQVQEYAEELAKLSGGVPVNIIGDDTIVFYRGKGYVQPKVMSPIDTLSKKRAYEKSKYEQSLESVRHFIAIAEKELELYYRHVALYDDPSKRNPLSILDDSSSEESRIQHQNELYLSCSDTEDDSEDEDESENEELCKLDNGPSSSSSKEELSQTGRKVDL